MSRDSGQHVHHDRRRHGRGAGGGPRGRGGGGGREEEAGAELHGEAGAAQQAAAGAGRGGGEPRPPPHTPTLLGTLQVTGGAGCRVQDTPCTGDIEVSTAVSLCLCLHLLFAMFSLGSSNL